MRRICLKRAAETEPKGFLRGRVSAYRHKLRQNVPLSTPKPRNAADANDVHSMFRTPPR